MLVGGRGPGVRVELAGGRAGGARRPPSSSMNMSTVVPLPTPTIAPSTSSSSAARAAARFSSFWFMRAV